MFGALHISRVAWLLPALLLGACASQVPRAIREAPADNPGLEAVRSDAAAYASRQVRWGGEILSTDNRASVTRLTVLARPLAGNGEPQDTDESDGRFIAVVPQFLEPSVYAPERKFTVSGTLLRAEAGKVGEFPYTYPVIQVDEYYLWPRPTLPPASWNPWWYDPWYYDPWYYDRYYYPRYPYR